MTELELIAEVLKSNIPDAVKLELIQKLTAQQTITITPQVVWPVFPTSPWYSPYEPTITCNANSNSGGQAVWNFPRGG